MGTLQDKGLRLLGKCSYAGRPKSKQNSRPNREFGNPVAPRERMQRPEMQIYAFAFRHREEANLARDVLDVQFHQLVLRQIETKISTRRAQNQSRRFTSFDNAFTNSIIQIGRNVVGIGCRLERDYPFEPSKAVSMVGRSQCSNRDGANCSGFLESSGRATQ